MATEVAKRTLAAEHRSANRRPTDGRRSGNQMSGLQLSTFAGTCDWFCRHLGLRGSRQSKRKCQNKRLPSSHRLARRATSMGSDVRFMVVWSSVNFGSL